MNTLEAIKRARKTPKEKGMPASVGAVPHEVVYTDRCESRQNEPKIHKVFTNMNY